MSKRKSWLCLIKGFFFLDPHHHHKQQQQKRSRRRIWLFGQPRRTKALPGLPPPPPSPPLPPPVEMRKFDAQETQRKCKEDDSLWNWEVPKSSEYVKNKTDVNVEHRKEDESLAAVKIQIAYRGHLARKALRALKGFVRLQAIIRGRAVRRQAMTTLKSLQAIVYIQSEVCTRRSQMALDNYYTDFQVETLQHNHKPKMETSRHGRKDDGLLPKEEEIDIILRKKAAILRKQRIKAHSFNHRISTESEEGKAEGRLRYWLEQYVNDQHSYKSIKLKNTEGFNNLSLHRRSFHTLRKHSSREDISGCGGSPTTGIPAYMAATESTKARARSTSTPRLRPVIVDRAYSDGDSPYKHKNKLISPVSSTRTEMTSSGIGSSQQKSPILKGVHGFGYVRSNWKIKDVSLDSDQSLLGSSRDSR